ncbi:DENN domain-containing protein 10 isoform X1 [Neofelis nebulosa]|uniref:DENN domain-containing protein 10 isoform X1 n=2 Tax=Neofelis nebulosa TaxID=61452 RepID=UPI00272C6CAE|nr:DENN domain-containing protein 10 isoform X1 [Neofelis nebulosa]
MAAAEAADTQLMLGVGLIGEDEGALPRSPAPQFGLRLGPGWPLLPRSPAPPAVRSDHLSTVEKDTNGEVLWVWCYPSTTATLRNLLLRKCCLTDENKLLHPFVFGQYRRTWFYITTVEVPDSSVLIKVTHFSIVLTAKDFNPEKYAAFTRILCRMYLKHGSPVKMMESYIAVLTKGICQSEENGSFLSKDFDARKAYLAGSIKDIVSQFGMETVILHTALMLKKRIVVYHPKIEAVQEFTRTLPALVWHRQDWTILHSYVHLSAEELEALRMCPGYIAGFVDLEVSNRSDLYDVFVNLADREITIAPLAKEAMTMGKLHKEIGQLIVQSAEDPEKSDGQVIQRWWPILSGQEEWAGLALRAETLPFLPCGSLLPIHPSIDAQDISLKTREIFTHLEPFSEVSSDGEKLVLNFEALKQRRFPPATENFLYHLAAAEQMLKI